MRGQRSLIQIHCHSVRIISLVGARPNTFLQFSNYCNHLNMEYLMRLFSVLCLFVLWALTPVYWLINRGKRNRVPPLTNPLLRLSATEVARKIRNREVSIYVYCIKLSSQDDLAFFFFLPFLELKYFFCTFRTLNVIRTSHE